MWDRTVEPRGARHCQFHQPSGLALTPDDAFLLLADTQNRRVLVLRATDGVCVRRLMGRQFTLHYPNGVAVVSSTGQVVVSDGGRNQVIQFRSIEDDSVVGTLGTGRGSGPTEFRSGGLAVLDGPCCPPARCFYFCSDTIIPPPPPLNP
jgi:DNA-binding beta-propeller fold protein YncE